MPRRSSPPPRMQYFSTSLGGTDVMVYNLYAISPKLSRLRSWSNYQIDIQPLIATSKLRFLPNLWRWSFPLRILPLSPACNQSLLDVHSSIFWNPVKIWIFCAVLDLWIWHLFDRRRALLSEWLWFAQQALFFESGSQTGHFLSHYLFSVQTSVRVGYPIQAWKALHEAHETRHQNTTSYFCLFLKDTPFSNFIARSSSSSFSSFYL